jgi:hypothetical protein
VARHIFQACPVWIYTQSNITQIVLYRKLFFIWWQCYVNLVVFSNILSWLLEITIMFSYLIFIQSRKKQAAQSLL